MAEQLVSAGVFTNENDLSFLPQGVADIGAAIIGPTPMGPAFIPTLIHNQNDYVTIFGNPDGDTFVPYTVQNYLQNSGQVTVVRVVNVQGYNSDAIGLELSGSATSSNLIFQLETSSLAMTIGTKASASIVGFNSSTLGFDLYFTGSKVVSSASFNPSSTSWLPTLIGATPGTTYPVYVSQSFSSYASSVIALTTTSSMLTTPVLYAGTSSLGGQISLTGSILIDSTQKTLAVLAPTDALTTVTASFAVTAINGLNFTLSSSLYPSIPYQLSFNPANNNYITNVLGTDPKSSTQFYIYANYSAEHIQIANALAGATGYTISIGATVYNNTSNKGIILSSSAAYVEGVTPWIQSQTINGSRMNLFKVHTFNIGPSPFKISISGLKMPAEMPAGTGGYGTFTLTVRDINDTDSRQSVLETYPNCTLDPTSNNYIAKLIGDQYRVYGKDADGNSKLFIYGDYPNNSKRIYIEIASNPIVAGVPNASQGTSIPANAMPFGFGPYYGPIVGPSTIPALQTVTSQYNSSTGNFNYMNYLGVDFTAIGDVLSLGLPLVNTSYGTVDTTSAFTLESCSMANAAGTAAIPFDATSSGALTNNNGKKARQFTLALQGGFNGMNPTIVPMFAQNITNSSNVMGFNVGPGQSGAISFQMGIDTVSNPDEFDINMLVVPGITNDIGANIISYANQMAINRGDVFFLFDATVANTTANAAVLSVQGIDSNYAATYYPWVKIYDQYNQNYLWVPPSVVMAGVIAFNDRVAAEWWAPAGLTRGGLDSVSQVWNRLTQAERDTLYLGRVNPIAAFAGLGFAAWGQKTLQSKSSALDRINVRRLLIALKKYIASASKYLVFEQNTNATRTRFLNIVNPYLTSVQQKQGLYAFKVVMDETNNTPDVIDRNVLIGDIYIQPAKTAEFIVINFNVLPTGATFSQ